MSNLLGTAFNTEPFRKYCPTLPGIYEGLLADSDWEFKYLRLDCTPDGEYYCVEATWCDEKGCTDECASNKNAEYFGKRIGELK